MQTHDQCPRAPASRSGPARGVALVFALVSIAIAAPAAESVFGIPFSRDYSLDEIGVSRGATLGFDPVNRLSVLDGHKHVVLNDANWIDIAAKPAGGPAVLRMAKDAFGRSFFGGLATWGELIYTETGEIVPKVFRPAACPEWVQSSNFNHVLAQADGVYFVGSNGVVYWNRAGGEQTFIEIPDIMLGFRVGAEVFVSSYSQGLARIDGREGRAIAFESAEGPLPFVENAASFPDGWTVVSTRAKQLLRFDGRAFSAWPGTFGRQLNASIRPLLALADGDLACAVEGQGLYVLGRDGAIKQSLLAPEYRAVNDLACNEPGVLWVLHESGVQRILYNDPVSQIDQRSGIAVSWPKPVDLHGQTFVVSHGFLYQLADQSDGLSSHFERAPRPEGGALSIAVTEHGLLVGNTSGIFLREGNDYRRVYPIVDALNLALVAPDQCLVLGKSQIGLLTWDGDQWRESPERIDGLGFPFIVHNFPSGVWLELGIDQAARIWLEDGRIRHRKFDRFPWADPTWVSIGRADGRVILTGPDGQRVFYDEAEHRLAPAPELHALLETSPYPVSRVMQSDDGTLWAAHEQGVALFRRQADGGYKLDFDSLRSLRERHPLIQFTGANDVWVSSGTSLYHVARDFTPRRHAPPKPALIAVVDRETGLELASAARSLAPAERYAYEQNSLAFRFFAGSYAYARAPIYEFSIRSGASSWSIRSADSRIELANLAEGSYQLNAQLLDDNLPIGAPYVADFEIDPPWYRSTPAYAAYWIAAIALALVISLTAIGHARRKREYLENLVRERTGALRATMEKLGQQERAAAILEERNRLAGEIHDSLQQGLSGLALQLEATLKLPDLATAVRSRLAVAKSMVSFTRQEVQRAVWDLESPLLDNADLAEALEKLANLIGSGSPVISVVARGDSIRLDTATKHHLLRVAQEAITNAVRHADATRISVRLDCSESLVSLDVDDDGCGFSPEQTLNAGLGHFGLRGMRGRVEKLEGEIDIESSPGLGTKVRIKIPLTNKKHSHNGVLI